MLRASAPFPAPVCKLTHTFSPGACVRQVAFELYRMSRQVHNVCDAWFLLAYFPVLGPCLTCLWYSHAFTHM